MKGLNWTADEAAAVLGAMRTVATVDGTRELDEVGAQMLSATRDEGTLGHTFFLFYRDRGFPLPGEKGGFSELFVSHDLTHVLSGFNTDMDGEVNIAAFQAGMSRTEYGWEMLMEMILDYHLGLHFTTAGFVEPGRGHFHPEEVLKGYERGLGCSVDLIADWDYWAVMDQPLAALRDRYGIDGVSGHRIEPPTQPHPHASSEKE